MAKSDSSSVVRTYSSIFRDALNTRIEEVVMKDWKVNCISNSCIFLKCSILHALLSIPAILSWKEFIVEMTRKRRRNGGRKLRRILWTDSVFIYKYIKPSVFDICRR